ncbi:MaoC/PaaZ C-terminal domain-containing protein [Arthrobacter sp. JZ12]|uniref:MaoC/PaaZ C-terminal domain-containing protein n=1 Tax=Arthrobacter sp. JZ12 TaxID=2654190 RepID=UPI002B459339|nr:MaoC/PaaZ C-terminal domain-containing protein [Arthrobacter sp. JZ12]
MPSLSSLYGKALVRPLQDRVRRSGAVSGLPAERHRVEGIAGAPDQVRGFQGLMRRPDVDVMPSGYVHTLVFPLGVSVLARPDFPLPLPGMIHLRNEIRHLRPIGLDERLTATAWVENLRGHRTGTQVDVVVEVEASGVPVWHGTSTYLAKGIQLALPETDPVSDPTSEPRQEAVPPPDYPTSVWALPEDVGRRYAEVSGDYNPIHLSRLTARAMGMKRPIAHGMYLASRMVADFGPGEESAFIWSADFHSPVSLPAQVALAPLTGGDNDGGGGREARSSPGIRVGVVRISPAGFSRCRPRGRGMMARWFAKVEGPLGIGRHFPRDVLQACEWGLLPVQTPVGQLPLAAST